MRSDNIKRVITEVNCKYGAPMGRRNIDTRPKLGVLSDGTKLVDASQPMYDKRVILIDGYDKGGAYWGIGKELRVEFNKDLTYINYYRKE